MSFKPLSDRVLVRPDAPLKVSRGGIIIPDSAQKKTGFGTIVAMGEGMRTKDGGRWPMPDVAIGARVVYAHSEDWPTIKIDGEELLQLREEAILAEIPVEPTPAAHEHHPHGHHHHH